MKRAARTAASRSSDSCGPDSPEETARHNLRQTLLALRKAIGDHAAPYLLFTRDEIQFNTAGDYSLDVAAFDGHLAPCDIHTHRRLETCSTCASRLKQAASVYGIEAALNRLGDLARSQGDYAQAGRLYEESLALYHDMGDQDEIPSLLHNLGYVAQHHGDYSRALDLFREGLVRQRDMGNAPGMAECLAGIAGVLTAEGEGRRGARLFGAAEAQRESLGATIWPANRIEYDRNLARLRASLDEATLAAAWAEGRPMSLEAAIAEALDRDTNIATRPWWI